MSVPVLDVRGLAYAYPDGHQALFGVDLHVHEGERVALLGPNGAGKTTTISMICGLLRRDGGEVTVAGASLDRDPGQVKAATLHRARVEKTPEGFVGNVVLKVSEGMAAMMLRQMASKGSVAVDGVSLTLVDVTTEAFSVALIPHTLTVTTLGRRQVGDRGRRVAELLGKVVVLEELRKPRLAVLAPVGTPTGGGQRIDQLGGGRLRILGTAHARRGLAPPGQGGGRGFRHRGGAGSVRRHGAPAS